MQFASSAVRSLRRPDRASTNGCSGGCSRAVWNGDLAGFQELHSADAVVLSDGGGRALAALRPVSGRDAVCRLILGLAREPIASGASIQTRIVPINGSPGLLLFLDGELDQAISLDVRKGRIRTLYLVRNPDKLMGFTGSP